VKLTKSFILAIPLLVLLPAVSCGGRAQDAGTDANSALLEKGSRVYRVHCRPCHLPEGNAPVLRMRLNDTQWNHGGSPEEIKKTISEGVNGTQMLSFKYKLSPEEVDAVANYVKNLCVRAQSK